MEEKSVSEECASMSFVQKFVQNYDTILLLNICKLKDAIEQNSRKSGQKRVIILYLHNEKNAFSTTFCSALSNPSVTEILKNNFFIIGWDVEEELYHDNLINALNQCRELSNLTHLIQTKISAALIIMPYNDSITLHSCMIGIMSEENFIWHLNNANKFIMAINSNPQTVDETVQYRMETDAVILEEDISLNFIQTFNINYPTSDVVLRVCKLKDAINKIITGEPKLLLLYLHNKNDKFSQLFCDSINKQEFNDILTRRFFILGWDVENEEYHQVLLEALDNYVELICLKDLIVTKKCAALIIVPYYHCITVFSCIRGNIKDKELLEQLHNAENSVKEEIELENTLEQCSLENGLKTNFDSQKFQQIMYDMLGNRDYDSFECSEHELLKKKIGYALYGPPVLQPDSTNIDYSKKETKYIQKLYEIIVKENNAFSKWKDRIIISFIYNCTEPLLDEKLSRQKKNPNYDPNSDITSLPIFVIRRCKNSEAPCRIFIDNTGRVYENWTDYIQNNHLDKCFMTLPRNGRYECDDNGCVLLEKHLSSACNISVKLLKGVDIAGTVTGVISGGVFAVAAIPAVTIAPVALAVAGIAGATFGVYSIARSAYSLYDKKAHKENMSLKDSEARKAYLNIVAGSLGFVGVGANMAVAELAARGFSINQGATALVNTINIAGISASGINVANSGYDVIDDWFNNNRKPSLLTMVQLSSSILFFGHAVYNFKQASTIIEESQANALKSYQESLRSNRHRKTFNKLLKETIKQNNDNVQRGRAEVISTIKNIPNKDETFAALTRSNKEMNKNGIKFYARNNQICLNDIEIDITMFNNMSKENVESFLQNFGSNHTPTPTEINNISSSLKGVFRGTTIPELTRIAEYCVTLFGNADGDIKSKIIHTVGFLLHTLLNEHVNIKTMLDDMFPSINIYFNLIDFIIQFYQTQIDTIENKFYKWTNSKDEKFYEKIFSFLDIDKTKRAAQILKYIIDTYYRGNMLTDLAANLLTKSFFAWFSEKVYSFNDKKEMQEQRKSSSQPRNIKVPCTICNGYYYQ